MTITFFNTMGRKKEPFRPLKEGQAGMYCCGPTVYSYAHIGNFRAYIFEDILRRTLEYNGLKVKHVMNVTDVGHLTSDADTGEDKMEVGARREKKTVWEIAELYTNQFLQDADRLNILRPTVICRATDHIQDMVELVQRLQGKGYTYTIDDGVYFDTSRFPEYGRLTGMSFERLAESLKAGARVEFNPQKRNITDFALWRFSPKGIKREMEWESPWGIGFPGWHIECSAMSMKYLGETFDIHTGGEDHIQIHHTSEIAQSEAATGKSFVNYWLHNAFLVFGGSAKMAKSKGYTMTVDTLTLDGFDPLAYRYLCLTAHYRSELLFTWENLKAAQNSLDTLRENVRLMRESLGEEVGNRAKHYRDDFKEAVNDDLDTPKALSIVWSAVRSKELSNKEKYELLLDFDRVLGLDLVKEEKLEELGEEARSLIEEREAARKQGNYRRADEIREKLRQMGILLEDTAKGARWRRAQKAS